MLRNRYTGVLILITIIIFMIMGLSTLKRPKVNVIEDTLGVIVTPVQKVFNNIGFFFRDTFQFVSEVKTLKQENDKLLIKIDELEKNQRELQDLKDENQRLREMLQLKDTLKDYEIIGAQVIAKVPGNWFSSFTIDKGTADGLQKNCTVMTSKGLVGHISEIGTNWSKVVSIIDGNGSASCLVVRTRDSAVVKGDLVLQNEGLCKMSYIAKDADVIAGDEVETSGLGGVFPKGMLIGKIREINSTPHEVFKYAVVEPVVDFKRIHEVFVVKNYKGLSEQ